MAHNAAILEVPLDPVALYDAEPELRTYVEMVLSMVADTRHKQQAEN